MIISIGPKNALEKIQYPFLIKNKVTLNKMAIEMSLAWRKIYTRTHM